MDLVLGGDQLWSVLGPLDCEQQLHGLGCEIELARRWAQPGAVMGYRLRPCHDILHLAW